MYILMALLGGVCASASAIFVKLEAKQTETLFVTSLRIIVVALFSWGIVIFTGAYKGFTSLTEANWLYLLLSGTAQTVTFRCYFKAIEVGEVSKVNPVERTSTVMTMLMGMFLLGEAVTIYKIIGMVLILAGTIMMLSREDSFDCDYETKRKRRFWLVWALVAALFSSFTNILAKVGLRDVDANLATAVRNSITLILLWTTVFTLKLHQEHRRIDLKGFILILLSGLATGLSLVFFHRALQMGDASIVVPIDRLGIIISVLFSVFILKEKLKVHSWIGLGILTAGTLLLLVGQV